MSQEQQPQRPVTYGDVFPVQGALASQPITVEDAALMQSAETLILGQSQKGGAAAIMQSAADQNLKAGLVEKGAHSPVAEEGVAVLETILTGEVLRTQYVAGQPICTSAEPTPTIPAVAAMQDAVTIGEALEAAALGAGDQPIEPSDARAIQSAEKRATGIAVTGRGGLAATAQSAAELNPRVDDFAKTTLSDVVTDASLKLASDKAVTREDAEKVAEAELRSRLPGELREGGVAATIQAAAEHNERAGLISPSSQMLKLKVEDSQSSHDTKSLAPVGPPSAAM